MSIKQTTPGTKELSLPLEKTRTYNEIVEFFNKHWSPVAFNKDSKSVDRIKKLDKALGSVSQKVSTILIAGTNGKSLTAHFTAKLLKEEGLTVGVLYAPHILTYNERFFVDTDYISNKIFTELANQVINASETNDIKATTQELLSVLGFLYFSQNNVSVALIEIEKGGSAHPVTALCNANIVAITRLTANDADQEGQAFDAVINDYMPLIKKDAHIISADQNKVNLKKMADYAKQTQAIWEMPIRKLTALAYPFEQLHGRCAALAERIATIFVNSFAKKSELVDEEQSLLMKKSGQRGRPTLEAKRQSELNPKRTLPLFWKEATSTLAGRFQILDKEKPTIIIDNAENIDSFENFLLGIRLMHYQKSLKGLTLIIGCYQDTINYQEFLRLIRYFCKKTSGTNIILTSIPTKDGVFTESWNPEKVAQDMKAFKIKARAVENFKDAFEVAKKSVTDRHGLIGIVGSSALIAEYWSNKGIKKL